MSSATKSAYLVTGASGFIGRHLVGRLLEAGHGVRAFVRNGDGLAAQFGADLDIVTGDIRDRDAVSKAVRGCERVIHLAAKVSDWGDYRLFDAITVRGTANVAFASENADVARLVLVSSDAVYGYHGGHFDADETTPFVARPIDPYTRSKIAAERICESTRRVELVIARPGWVWGPGDTTILPRLLDFIDSRAFFFAGHGTNLLNLAYVSNVCDALLTMAEHPDAAGQAFNVNDGQKITARQFFEQLRSRLGLQPRAGFSLPYAGVYAAAHMVELFGRLGRLQQPPPLTRFIVDAFYADMDFSPKKLEQRLGCRPRVSWERGLQELAAWWAEHRGQPEGYPSIVEATHRR